MNAEELAQRIEAEAAVAARPGQLDSLEQIAREVRALACAPTADVAAELRRLAGQYDELATHWESVDDSVRASVYQIEAAALRKRAAAPEGVDAADEQSPCLSRGCTEPRGHTDDHESADGDTWGNSIDDPGADVARKPSGGMADELTAAQAAIQRVRELHFATEPGEWICEECSQDSPCPTVRALDGDTTEES